MNYRIPTASEANTRTNEAVNNYLSRQLEGISQDIEAAIAVGKFSINGNGSLDILVKRKLEELGYKVKTGHQYNEPYYIISWEQ